MEQDVFMKTMHAMFDKAANYKGSGDRTFNETAKANFLREAWKLFQDNIQYSIDLESMPFLLALVKTHGIESAERQAKAIKKLLTS